MFKKKKKKTEVAVTKEVLTLAYKETMNYEQLVKACIVYAKAKLDVEFLESDDLIKKTVQELLIEKYKVSNEVANETEQVIVKGQHLFQETDDKIKTIIHGSYFVDTHIKQCIASLENIAKLMKANELYKGKSYIVLDYKPDANTLAALFKGKKIVAYNTTGMSRYVLVGPNLNSQYNNKEIVQRNINLYLENLLCEPTADTIKFQIGDRIETYTIYGQPHERLAKAKQLKEDVMKNNPFASVIE